MAHEGERLIAAWVSPEFDAALTATAKAGKVTKSALIRQAVRNLQLSLAGPPPPPPPATSD